MLVKKILAPVKPNIVNPILKDVKPHVKLISIKIGFQIKLLIFRCLYIKSMFTIKKFKKINPTK